MKKKLIVLAILVAFCASCALFQTATTKTETIVIGYESIAMVAFPTVRTYLVQREANGSLAGQALIDAKVKYALAKEKFIQAGNLLKMAIESPQVVTMQTFTTALQAVAVMLADLSGGSVQGNQLTIPKAGGVK